MSHFRNLVALVFREFTAQVLGKHILEVNAVDIGWYSTTLRNNTSCNGIRDTVKCIFYILTGKHAKTQVVADLVTVWIKRVSPLANVSTVLNFISKYNTIFFFF